MQEKEELREKAKQIRSLLHIDQISEKIVENILAFEMYQNAKNVMIFYPLKDEINILGLLKNNTYGDKNFYLPKVQDEELVVCPYKAGDKLVDSKFKTKEPVTQPVDAGILDMIFIPALLVDRNFHRLGYGKGFYDKFLSKNAPNATRVVPISSLLVRENLPSEDFDAPFDIIVDEL